MIQQGNWMDLQLQLLTWKEVTSIQAQAAMPKEVNDFCSLGAIWFSRYVGGIRVRRDAAINFILFFLSIYYTLQQHRTTARRVCLPGGQINRRGGYYAVQNALKIISIAQTEVARVPRTPDNWRRGLIINPDQIWVQNPNRYGFSRTKCHFFPKNV